MRRLTGAMEGIKVRAWSATHVPAPPGPLTPLAYALPWAEGAAGVNYHRTLQIGFRLLERDGGFRGGSEQCVTPLATPGDRAV